MSPSQEFKLRVEAELLGIASCIRRCESHTAPELNLAYLRHIGACASRAARGTTGVQLAQVRRTENKMPKAKAQVEEVQEKAVEEQKFVFPKTIGACVDRAYQLREKRLKLERQAAEIKSEEEATKAHVLETFGQSDVEGVRGKVATASITKRTVGTVSDWSALYAYIKENDAFDMLHRRLSDAAYRERLDAQESVPGVQPFEVVALSLTKR